jgi:acetyltransferase-like isoleucine patch superfamily enzyme
MTETNKRERVGKNVEMEFGSIIEDQASIGEGVRIGKFAQILSGAVIERSCTIGSHCIIGHQTKFQLQQADFSLTSERVVDLLVKEPVTRIGEGSIIRSNSIIYKHVVAGRKLRTGHGVVIREHVTLGDSCVVGTQAILDGYIRVGNKSMIESQCYIAQSVRMGDGVFLATGCIISDNKRIILGEGLWGPTIEDYVRMGAGVTILPNITIGKHALIGAGSTVTKSIPPKAIAYGNPANVKGFQTDKDIEAYVESIKTWE